MLRSTLHIIQHYETGTKYAETQIENLHHKVKFIHSPKMPDAASLQSKNHILKIECEMKTKYPDL
jgi:hypothetical protein